MVAEHGELLSEDQGYMGNGCPSDLAYGHGKRLEFRIPATASMPDLVKNSNFRHSNQFSSSLRINSSVVALAV